MDFAQIAETRRSVKQFDPETAISDEELTTLFEQVVLTPSSFNLQHWSFVAVRDKALKSAMQEIAWGQQQVSDSSVAILVSGKLNAYEDAPTIYAETPPSVQDMVLPMIDGFYRESPQSQRDEAVRSGSLAAMSLMYAAQDMGFATGPMIGFNSDAMVKLLHLPENHIPVMLIVLGKGVGELRARAYRRPLSEVVKLDYFDGESLGGG